MKYKLLALDIDGTLLNSRRQLTDRTRDAISRAIDSGVHVTLSTGRPIIGVRKYVELLGLRAPIITYNGAEIVDPVTDERLFAKTLEYDDALKIMELGQSVGTSLCIWSCGALYGLPIDDRVNDYKKISGIEPLPVESIEELAKRGVTKIIWYDTVERVNEFRKTLDKSLFHSVNFCTSNPAFLEFFCGDVSKRVAMEKLCELLGILKDETVAIGDGLNDIPMLEYAGLGIAMGNAADEVKTIAKKVVSDNDSDGVAEAIESFILK